MLRVISTILLSIIFVTLFFFGVFCVAVTAYADPQVAIATSHSPPAPTALVVVGCRVDDFTGKPGRQDVSMAAHDWRDLEWHIANGELQCKREVNELQDQAVVMDPSGHLAKPLNSNFGDFSQCAHAGGYWSVKWNEMHRGWAVMAIGCPSPIVDEHGRIVAWHLPECPEHLGALQGIKCKYDESVI